MTNPTVKKLEHKHIGQMNTKAGLGENAPDD